MICCRHPVDDHGAAGCCECRCRLARADHPARPEVDDLEDWRRCTDIDRLDDFGNTLAAWLNSPAWLTPPTDTTRPGPVAGEIGS